MRIHLTSLTLLALLGCGPESPAVTTEPTNEPVAPGSDLVIVTYGGGEYQASHVTAFVEPFSATTGIEASSINWGADYGTLSTMVASGQVEWDVVEVTAGQFTRGLRDSLFAPLASLPDSFAVVAGAPGPHPYGVPNVYWSTVLAFPRDHPWSSAPDSWADFWDVESYPGPRALYDDPRGNLEFALLADGVPIDDLYPLDIDRAFRKLDEIKPHVRIWWDDGTAAVAALSDGRVAMSSAWSGRIFASTSATESISFVWTGAAHELDYWIIPRGSGRVGDASSFIAFASRPFRMARQAAITAYGPANGLALDQLDQEVVRNIPTFPANWTVSFVIHAEWWSQNETELAARWLAWK